MFFQLYSKNIETVRQFRELEPKCILIEQLRKNSRYWKISNSMLNRLLLIMQPLGGRWYCLKRIIWKDVVLVMCAPNDDALNVVFHLRLLLILSLRKELF